jgi:hypothetical protein
MKNRAKFYWKHREAIVCIVILLTIIFVGLALIEAAIEQI